MATLKDDYIATPTEAQGYLVAARGMLEGARVLGRIDPPPAFALTLLCGHACEAALKAMLAQGGMSSSVLSKPPFGHSILKIWATVEKQFRGLPNPQPAWVGQLDRVYDAPFHLRYPLGFHGIVLPHQSAMLSGTEELVTMAERIVK